MIFDLLKTATPLLLASIGALASEMAGIMAVFADGFINLGGFIFYVALYYTGSSFVSCVVSGSFCTFIALLAAWTTNYLKANPFLTGLALNVSVSGIITLTSVVLFETRGVLSFEQVMLSSLENNILIFVSYGIAVLFFAILSLTKTGLYLGVAGTSPDVLSVRGINPLKYKIAGWGIAGFLSALAGCLLVAKLSAFVPNISSGRGWLALAAVFLGKKRLPGTVVAVVVFSVAEYAANNIQRIPFFSDLPSALLLILPYAFTLVLIGSGLWQNKKTN